MKQSIKDKYSTERIQNLELSDEWTDETEGELEAPKMIRAWKNDQGHKILIYPGENTRYEVKEVTNGDKVLDARQLTDSDQEVCNLAEKISKGELEDYIYEDSEVEA